LNKVMFFGFTLSNVSLGRNIFTDLDHARLDDGRHVVYLPAKYSFCYGFRMSCL